MLEAVEKEIKELHKLFQDWYQGLLPESDLMTKIGGRLAEDFSMTFPDGSIHSKSDLLHMMKNDRANDSHFRIEISDITVKELSHGLYLAEYQESQFWGGSSTSNLQLQTTSQLKLEAAVLRWISIQETKIDV